MTLLQAASWLLAPLPAPYLAFQAVVPALWAGAVIVAVRAAGPNGFWLLLTAPIAVVGWCAVKIIVVVIGGLVMGVTYNMFP